MLSIFGQPISLQNNCNYLHKSIVNINFDVDPSTFESSLRFINLLGLCELFDNFLDYHSIINADIAGINFDVVVAAKDGNVNLLP